MPKKKNPKNKNKKTHTQKPRLGSIYKYHRQGVDHRIEGLVSWNPNSLLQISMSQRCWLYSSLNIFFLAALV